MGKTGTKRVYKALAVFLGILVFFAALIIALVTADLVCERTAHVIPSYEKQDIREILCKDEWTDEDYDIIYHQTGLGKQGVHAIKRGNPPALFLQKALEFQEALFYEGEYEHEIVAFTTKRDLTVGYEAPVVPVEAGDVLVSSSSHSFGWRNGHAALAIDSYGSVIESLSVGIPSAISTNDMGWFAESSNFIVLRLKDVSKEDRAEIAANARRNLLDVPYSLTVGIFGKKDRGATPDKTQCAHLVWQAYKNMGYDIDANGGGLVVPRDVARSPLFEVVQVYGFDPDKLW